MIGSRLESVKLVLIKRALVLVSLSLAAFTTAARAQDKPALGTVSGTVQDPAGAVIAGARVALGNAAGIDGNRSQETAVQTTITDNSGSFKFTRVPAGTYKLEVQSNGFATQVIDIRVGPQSPAPQRILMAIDRLTQEATVTSTTADTQISTDTSQNQNSVSMSASELRDLPIFDQDYVGTLSRFLDPGATGTSGVSLVVDGIEANSVGVSASAIKEVK